MVAVPIGDTAGGTHVVPRRRIGGRFSSGHLVMVVAGLAGAVLAFAALHQQAPGTEVAVAARQIRAGETVRDGDFRVERVDAGRALIATFVPARAIRSLDGRIAATTIEPGEAVVGRNLRRRAARSGLRAMSIPIDPSHAVAGRLAAGDRVDVLVVTEHDVSIVVGDAEVVAVDARGRAAVGETTSPFTVTIAVDAAQSQLLASAIADGELSLARTTGAEPSPRVPARSTDDDSASGGTASRA